MKIVTIKAKGLGGDSGTSSPLRRLSTQGQADRYVGTFQFAQSEAQIYQKTDGSLYIKYPKCDVPITLCKDGKVVIGKVPPIDITPSLKDALKRI